MCAPYSPGSYPESKSEDPLFFKHEMVVAVMLLIGLISTCFWFIWDLSRPETRQVIQRAAQNYYEGGLIAEQERIVKRQELYQKKRGLSGNADCGVGK
jgi:hypothetical protein